MSDAAAAPSLTTTTPTTNAASAPKNDTSSSAVPTSVPVALLEVLTVGLPFCAFKLLAGALVIRGDTTVGHIVGIGLIVLGISDVLVNVVNAFGLVLARRRLIESCTLSLFSRGVRRRSRAAWTWAELGTSIDVLLSMTLVALVIGLGGIAKMTPIMLTTWNIAVIANVLGAGVARFGHSLHQHRAHRR